MTQFVNDLSSELQEFLEMVKNHRKMAAMVAPSYVVDFSYPEIIGKLKRLGFSYVLEVAAGAAETNRQVVEKLKNDSKSRFIMSPCPSIVSLVRNKFPDLVKYLAMTDTPMTATAKIVLKKFLPAGRQVPGVRPVFIGPCVSKKLEARQYPELNILVLTYKEIQKAFEILPHFAKASRGIGDFDVVEEGTRIYPMGGGLSQSAKISEFLKTEEMREVSGFYNVNNALNEFANNPKIRVLDILFCEGGCINGPGVISKDSLEEKKKRLLSYAKGVQIDKNCRGDSY